MADLQLCQTSRAPERHSSSSMIIARHDNLNSCFSLAAVEEYEPAEASQKGEGWPYAPEGWPKPGDKWIWKVGRRKHAKGYWQDRYLLLPKRLQKGRRKIWFWSKKSIEEYVKNEFPGTDLDTFFGSFQWRVPYATDTPTPTPTQGKTTVKRVRESEVGGNISERRCKVGNLKCGLETGKTKSLKAMNCDICCIEFGFCRECSCILCGKATDQSVGDYCSIRCEGKLNDEFVCGHVAHLECALLCHMAGVEQSIGLDVEYYCRRCDKKTNLMMHVSSILHASESLEVRADVEKNLGLALRIIQGTRQIVGRRLQNNIELSLKKLRSGMNLEDIVELHQNSMTGDEGNAIERLNYQLGPLNISPVSLANSRGQDNKTSESPFGNSCAAGTQAYDLLQAASTVPDITSQKGSSFVHDILQRRSRLLPDDTNGPSDLLNSPVHITALKFENKINQALHGLRKSQEAEYKLAQQKLYAQKDFLLSLFQELDIANNEFTNDSSSSSLDNFDDLLVGVSDRVGRLRKETAKFGQMLSITNGFGRTRKDILRDYFEVLMEDEVN